MSLCIKENQKKKKKKEKRRMINDENNIDMDEFKIIQKCVLIEDKNICVTYYYGDAGVTLDYNVVENGLVEEDNNSKYFETFAWIWDRNNGTKCNDELIEDGNICVDVYNNEVIVELDKNKKEQIKFSLLSVWKKENWSEIYDVEFGIDNKVIHKKK
eukprot:711221_1